MEIAPGQASLPACSLAERLIGRNQTPPKSPRSRRAIIACARAHQAPSALRAYNESSAHDCALEAARAQDVPQEQSRMPKIFLILALVTSGLTALTSSSAKAHLPFQEPRPLTLRQIEQLIESGIDDEVIAREIRERSLAFRLPAATLEQLVKRGAGEQTRQALLRQEERAAYAAYMNEKQDAAKRLALGKEFLRRHPRSERAAEVESGNRRATLEIFNAAYNAFSANPGAASLDRLLATGREILSQGPDQAVAAQVTSQLALATGRGMIGNFYSDLEQ